LVVALTYGPNADWVRNVVAARSCRVKWAGRWRTFSRVEVVEGAAGLALLGPLLRVPLGLAGITTVLRLRP